MLSPMIFVVEKDGIEYTKNTVFADTFTKEQKADLLKVEWEKQGYTVCFDKFILTGK